MRHRPARRNAFTLVELLIVILIIGLLAALITAAANRAIVSTRQSAITLDLNQFETAMQSYKNDTSGYFPPDMSYPTATATLASYQIRQNRIMQHLRKCYPRALFVDKSGNTANGYGPAKNAVSSAPASLQAATQNWFQTLPNGLYGVYPATPSGDVWGNVDNLDPAEALVFWIGGMPEPSGPLMNGTGKWLFKLYGFSANKQTPFAIGGSRTPGPYEFSTSRLGDADGDGWPEFYPANGDVPQPAGATYTPANPVPPYVYFDSASYDFFTVYDSTGTSGVATYPSPYPMNAAALSALNNSGYQTMTLQPSAMAGVWGIAVPYAQIITPTPLVSNTTGTITWVNDQKFQVISAGIDTLFCSVDAMNAAGYRVNFPLFPTPQQPPPLPGTFSLDVTSASDPNVQRYGEQDNLANFAGGRLQDGGQP